MTHSFHDLPSPRAGSVPATGSAGPALLGRQSIFTATGELFGAELLYRCERPRALAVDRWSAAEQDGATKQVVETALGCGLARLGGRRPVFVNATRSLLLGHLVAPLPRQIGLEVVESVVVDDAVLEGVARLRAHGHLVAVDDFSARPDQIRLLPHADIVKIDLRDLARHGTALLEVATSWGATTVVERVETPEAFDRCVELGFDLFQGNLLEPALVLEVGPGWSRRRDTHACGPEATRSTARSTAKTGSRPAPFTSASA